MMIDKFLEEFAKLLVDNPSGVRVERSDVDGTFCDVVIYADKIDTGKLIGKDGKMDKGDKSKRYQSFNLKACWTMSPK